MFRPAGRAILTTNPTTPRAESQTGRRIDPTLACVAGFALLAVASYGFQLYDLVGALLSHDLLYTLVDRDFANYWVAGHMVLSGDHMALFSHDDYFARLQALFGSGYQIRSWSYPPHYLLMIWPLGFLDYKTGMIAFLTLTFALFLCSVIVFRARVAPESDPRVLALALVGYVLMMFVATQNGFLTSALLLFALAWRKARPVAAGLALACLTVKPQLGILLPFLLLAERSWRTILWASIFSVLLVGASAVIFGVDSWAAYLTDTLAYQSSVMTDWYGIFLRMMPTTFGSVRTLGFSPTAAFEAQIPVSIAGVMATLWLLRHERDALRRLFGITCATFLVTPYAFNYDMGALSACAAMLATVDGLRGRGYAIVPIALVAAISGAVTNLGRAGVPLTPLVLAAGLGALVWAVRVKVSASPPRETPAFEPTRS